MTEMVPAPEGGALAKFFAKQVIKGLPGSSTVKASAVDEVQLANRITEIEIETQVAGASYLKVHIIDPEWALTTSDWLKIKEGLLEPIEVEFPESSGWHWILCAVEGSTSVAEANLTVTFEDRIVYFLRQYFGEKLAPAGTQTRAQFIRDLVSEIGHYGEERAGFVCPSLNVIQIVENEGEAESKKTKTEQDKQEKEEQKAKRGGLGAGSFQIKGTGATPQQALDMSKAIQTAERLKAPTKAVEAMIIAGIGESTFEREASNSGHNGIWQSATIPGKEVERQAEFFLKGGESFQGGGAIKLSEQTSPSLTPGEIATTVEAGGQPASFYEVYLPEARAIITESGGIKPSVEESISDVGQLQRGTTANPDEDSFECSVRLATQVDWFFFSDNRSFFYEDGPTLSKQKPALYLDIRRNHIKTPKGENKYGVILSPTTYNFDDTTFEYRLSHKLKTRVQRKSKAVKPASPAEVKLLLECGINEFHAGDVFKFENSGPISTTNNGVWIITNTRRDCLKETSTEFILEPPIEPLPEPRATGSTEGKAGGATEQAQIALAERSKYVYSEQSDRGNNGTLFGPEPRTMDCSSFVTLCYKAAGLPDPSNKNYEPIGATSTIIANCNKVGNPTKDDLCFFGPSESETIHVTLYVGNGKAIAMQAPGITLGEGEAKTFGPGDFLGYYRPKNY